MESKDKEFPGHKKMLLNLGLGEIQHEYENSIMLKKEATGKRGLMCRKVLLPRSAVPAGICAVMRSENRGNGRYPRQKASLQWPLKFKKHGRGEHIILSDVCLRKWNSPSEK